jgi:hypothetical protein
MAQTGYTPIQLYYSTTAAATPTSGNLANGELAVNITDGKLYYKDNTGTVKLLASNAATTNVASFQTSLGGLTPSTATTGVVTLAGTLNTTSGGTGLTSFTAGDIAYYATGTALTKLAIGTAGYFLSSSGTAPQWSQTLGVANGGTGLNTLTTGRIPYGAGTSALGNSANLFFDSSNVRLGVGTASPAVTTELVGTDAMLIPKGATGSRPTGVAGYLRFNTTSSEFEGYNGTAWASVGGSAISNDTSTSTNIYPALLNATTGTATNVYTSNAKLLYKPSTGEFQASVPVASNGIVVNSLTVTTSYTIAAGFSGASAGPITIASGAVVTVAGGSRWVIS